ncbi:thiol:disulfide interchange protein DsbA/DsbL [Shewanella sp.]|uniref:thiol:disulfide interchange protein DsbA/DsbL n=1 Tax=Shewanella sp. TaxID=50422 RepID=UPI003F3AFD26
MIKPLALAAALLITPLSAFANNFIEGTHFTQVSDKASSEPKLTEFYSFYCHNCFYMETNYLPGIKANLNPKITFDSKHVDFMNSAIGTEVMRALAAIQSVDTQQQALTHAMFAAIQGEEGADGHDHSAPGHKHESLINNRDDIKKVFAKFGIDGAKYDELADSKSTNEKLALWRTQQQQFRVESVPAFIVNDKYAINLGSIKTVDELNGLINYLAIEKDVPAPKSAGGSLAWFFLAFAAAIGLGRQKRLLAK